MRTKLFSIVALVVLFIFTGCNGSTPAKQNATFLMDKSGMTLYTFDKDTKNISNCYNGCLAKWPPFYGDASELNLPANVSKEDFGTIIRKNGAKQTTYKSQPLYYFFKDTQAHEKKGDGVKGVWHIIK